MRERPILFSAPMARAVLEGRKTQTRRAVKPQPYIDDSGNFCWNGMNFGQDFNGPHIQAIASPLPSSKTKRLHCLFGKPGDRLWVRENGWERPERTPKMMREGADTWAPYYYDADGLSKYDHADFKEWGFKRRPSIHMPRWASRILLEVTAVRVERLQDISEADAQAEGARWFPDISMGHPSANPNRWSMELPTNTDQCLSTARYAFANLFCKVNGKGRGDNIDLSPWDANPWVWVIEFRRLA